MDEMTFSTLTSNQQHNSVKNRWASFPKIGGPLLYALMVLAAGLVFWSGIVSLVIVWQTPEYSHGPIIPLLSAFMFLKEMKAVPPATKPISDRLPGLLVCVFGLLIGLGGNVAQINDIVTYGMIVWIYGLVLLSFGWKRGWVLWPGVLHLVFMLPLPSIIYWQLSVYLQLISSEIGVFFVALAGIPVYLDGNIIDLGIYKLQVAEACSGLRYLFPIMSFSYVFSVLYTGPVWHKVVLLLSAAPITILMNSFRIGMIGVLVDNFGISQAEGFLHAFEGWAIFVACIAILFLLAVLMQRFQPNPQPLAETLDMSFDGLPAQMARFRSLKVSPAAIVATLITMSVCVLVYASPQRALIEPPRDPLVVFPTTLGDWSPVSYHQLERNVERTLAADDYLSVKFAKVDKTIPHVDLFVAYYDDLTISGIHSPEVCIPNGGWEVSKWDSKVMTVEGANSSAEIQYNQAVIQKGLQRQLVFYWFEQRGRRISNDFVAKAYTIFDAAVHSRADGALVRLVTPFEPDESEEAAASRLIDFARDMMPRLSKHVPE